MNKDGSHPSPELPERQQATVREIGRLHGEVREATRQTVARIIELGKRLTKLKEEVGRGAWLPFVSKHLPFGDRTAARYMKVYNHRVALTDKFDSVSDLQLSEAYEVLTQRKSKGAGERHEPVDDPPDAPGRERGKADILTGIQRSVADRLERLSDALLAEFESDLRTFLENWMQRHQQQEVRG